MANVTPLTASDQYKDESKQVALTVNNADPANTAAQNTAAIQAALDAGGYVPIKKSGIYLINTPLAIGANTQLDLAPDVTLQQAPLGPNGTNMLVTKAYQTVPSNITMAWTTGITATVTWASHGLIADDWASIEGVTPSVFIGVFRVESVTDVNTFVVSLWRIPESGDAPTATGASILARKADVNVSVTGKGLFDYDTDNNSPGTVLVGRHCVLLGHIHELIVDIRVTRTEKFCLNVGAVDTFDLRCEVFNTTSDGVKVYGPARFGTSHASGVSGDDLNTVHTRERDLFAWSRWTYGDCLSVKMISDGDAGNGGSPLALLPSTNEFMDIISVECRGGHETASNATQGIRILGDFDLPAGPDKGQAGNITVKNSLGVGRNFLTLESCHVNSLVIEPSCTFIPTDNASAQHGVVTKSDVRVDYLECSLTVNKPSWPASTAAVVQHEGANSTIGLIKVSAVLIGASGSAEIVRCKANVESVVVTDSFTDTAIANSVVINTEVTSNPNVSVVNCDIEASSCANLRAASTARVSGCRLREMFNGVFRSDSGACSFSEGGGNTLTGSSVWMAAIGTSAVTVLSPGIQVDVGDANIVATNGSLCMNTTVNGTLEANRLVTCAGTVWTQLDTPGNTFP